MLILSTILLLSDQNTFTAEAAKANPEAALSEGSLFQPFISFDQDTSIRNFALSPDGRFLAMVNGLDKLRAGDLKNGSLKELKVPAPDDTNKSFTEVSFTGKDLLATSYYPEIWDPETGICQWVLINEDRTDHAQLSPDRSLLLTVKNVTATVWGVKEKKPLHNLNEAVAFSTLFWLKTDNHFWSPNGNLIVLPLLKNNAFGVWNSWNSEALYILSGHAKEVQSFCFSPNENMFASSSFDNTIRVWCLEEGSCLNVLEGHTQRCHNIFFTPGGQVITPSLDETIRVWDGKTGECLKALKGHKAGITTSTFCPEAGILATGSDDKTVMIWDIKTGEPLQKIDCSGWVDKIAFDKKGKKLAIGSGKHNGQGMTIKILAILPKTYFELLNSTLYDNQELKRRLSALRAKEQDKEATIKRLWQLFWEEIDSPHFDIDKAQLLLRELEYLKVVIPETINEFMLKKTPPEKLFPLNEQKKIN